MPLSVQLATSSQSEGTTCLACRWRNQTRPTGPQDAPSHVLGFQELECYFLSNLEQLGSCDTPLSHLPSLIQCGASNLGVCHVQLVHFHFLDCIHPISGDIAAFRLSAVQNIMPQWIILYLVVLVHRCAHCCWVCNEQQDCWVSRSKPW